MFKKIFFVFLSFFFFNLQSIASDIDNNLPPQLPLTPINDKSYDHNDCNIITPEINFSENYNNYPPIDLKNFKKESNNKKSITSIKIPKWKTFEVKLLNNISSYSRKGTVINFSTIKPLTLRYVTIPANTIIKGKIIDSHPAQITGNGGLIVIALQSIQYKGKYYPITSGKVTYADSKIIFFNNIKGKRKYLKNTINHTTKPKKFMKKMTKVSDKLTRNSITLILSPLPVCFGGVVYLVNFITSPIFGFFSKGDNIYIKSGSKFKLKLTEDVYL